MGIDGGREGKKERKGEWRQRGKDEGKEGWKERRGG